MRSLATSRLRLVAALAGLNLLLVAAGWLVLVSPQRHHAHTAAQQVQQTQSEIARLGQSSGPQAARPHQPEIKTADLYRLAQAMPQTADEPDLLLALDQLARSSGVRVLALSPQSASAAVGYVVLPVSLNLQGDYASLTRFLQRLRALVAVRRGKLVATGRLFSVTSVALTPAAGKQLTATVSLDAFVYGPVGAAVPLSSTTSTSTGTTSTTTTSGG